MKRFNLIFSLYLVFSLSALCSVNTTPRELRKNLESQLAGASQDKRVELLLQLSRLNTDSIPLAYKYAHSALSEAYQLGDAWLKACAFSNMAYLNLKTGSPTDTIAANLAMAENAYKASGKSFDPEFYYLKAEYYFAINTYAAATALCQKAIETAQDKDDNLVLAKTFLLQARIAKLNGDINNFVENLRQSEKQYRLCNDKAAAGRALIGIGLLYNDAGMFDVAQKVLIRATKLCEQTSDSLFMAYLYCNTASVYKSGPDKNQTNHILIKAVSIFTKLRNVKGLGYAQNMLGLYFVELKNYDEAFKWFTLAVQSKSSSNDWQGACFATCNIADMNMLLKKYDPVVSALTEAEKYMNKAGDKLSAIVYYNTYGRFKLLNQDFPEAISSLSTSLRLAKQTGNANFLLDNLKALSDLYHITGDEKKALEYFRHYSEAGDSIRNATKPLQQEELIRELNNDELISAAVKERETMPKDSPGVLVILITATGLGFLIVLSLRVYKNKSKGFSKQGNDIHTDNNNTLSSDERDAKLILNSYVQQTIWERLDQAMEINKHYLRHDLTLHELALLLETNTLYLSKVINDRTGQNFSSFINQYRIEEACRLLLAEKQQVLSIEGIALSSGFNSKSAFNAAFRKLKGMTPSEFIEKQKKAG